MQGARRALQERTAGEAGIVERVPLKREEGQLPQATMGAQVGDQAAGPGAPAGAVGPGQPVGDRGLIAGAPEGEPGGDAMDGAPEAQEQGPIVLG